MHADSTLPPGDGYVTRLSFQPVRNGTWAASVFKKECARKWGIDSCLRRVCVTIMNVSAAVFLLLVAMVFDQVLFYQLSSENVKNSIQILAICISQRQQLGIWPGTNPEVCCFPALLRGIKNQSSQLNTPLQSIPEVKIKLNSINFCNNLSFTYLSQVSAGGKIAQTVE